MISFILNNVNDELILDINNIRKKFNGDLYIVNVVYEYFRKIKGLYLKKNIIRDKGKLSSAKYIFSILNADIFNNIFNGAFNKQFNNIKQMESIMAKPPYDIWSDAALADELKRRGYKPANISDHDVLVEMLITDDQKKIKTKDKYLSDKNSLTKSERNYKMKAQAFTIDELKSMELSKLLKMAKKNHVKVADPKSRKDIVSSLKNASIITITKTTDGEAVSKVSKKSVKNAGGSVDKKVKHNKAKKNTGSELTGYDRRIAEAKDAGDDAEVARLIGRRKREEQRKKSITPELKAKIKEFKKKFAGQKINWNRKIKKAGYWINGIQFISNYEKYVMLNASPAKRKQMLADIKSKREEVSATIGKSVKRSAEYSEE